MLKNQIDGVFLTSLKKIKVEGGDVLHAVKKHDRGFKEFGEAYFSTVSYKSIKAWKKHTLMTLNLVVPFGKVSVVIYDDRVDSKTHGSFNQFIIGAKNYYRLTIPPSLWFGFKGMYKQTSIILNVANIVHDPNEVKRKDLKDLLFNWENLK